MRRAVLIGLVVIYAGVGWRHAGVWQSDQTLWRDAVMRWRPTLRARLNYEKAAYEAWGW